MDGQMDTRAHACTHVHTKARTHKSMHAGKHAHARMKAGTCTHMHLHTACVHARTHAHGLRGWGEHDSEAGRALGTGLGFDAVGEAHMHARTHVHAHTCTHA